MHPGRFVYVVLDGVGVGALPDAAAYGDTGADTLGNLTRLVEVRLPNLQRLGLGNISSLRGVPPAESPTAFAGRLAERSAGKDTTAGHWEHMGIVTREPFPTYPDGFPEEVVRPFEAAIGSRVLGNRPASGTEIIAELGEEHLRTGRPIVYTSADSVFQIAAHVDVIPLADLYGMCRLARGLLTGPHRVGRVIARPFEGAAGSFRRTADRKDFSVEPPGETVLDRLVSAGVQVTGLGKIPQIFAGQGISREVHVESNGDNLAVLTRLVEAGEQGLLFTNLVDFDMKWGHRNDPDGFARGLEEFDRALPRLLEGLGEADRLLITADHGVDPTTVGTDHTREHVPVLLYPKPPDTPRGVYRGWFADTGATVADHFLGLPEFGTGRSLLRARREDMAPAPHPKSHGGDRLRRDALSAAAQLAEYFGDPPLGAAILGSGWASLGAHLVSATTVTYGEVSGWPTPTVEGHPGTLAVGDLSDHRVCLLLGRAHRYERPESAWPLAVVDALWEWGVRRLLLTNASGSLGQDPEVGSLVRVRRILDLQKSVYDPEAGRNSPLSDEILLGGDGGHVYAAVPGPQYETAAEVAALRALGATLVGMSTADEARAARARGFDVEVLSVVTNRAGTASLGAGEAEHADIIRRGDSAEDRMAEAVLRWVSSAGPGQRVY